MIIQQVLLWILTYRRSGPHFLKDKYVRKLIQPRKWVKINVNMTRAGFESVRYQRKEC